MRVDLVLSLEFGVLDRMLYRGFVFCGVGVLIESY